MARYLETCGCREWYRVAEDRRRWREVVQFSPPVAPVVCSVVCAGCQRLFRRESDRKTHKCSDVRALSIHQQPGAVRCGICNRWFAAAGGLARHRCDASVHSASELELSRPPPGSCQSCSCHCVSCGCCFCSLPGYRRHNCRRGSRLSAGARADLPFACDNCRRRFRWSRDLNRHICKSFSGSI